MRPIARWLTFVGAALLLAAATMALPGISARSAHAAGTGPVAEWTFDEASGTSIGDSVGGSNGTMSGGVTRITGDVPQGTGALSFDGTNGEVVVPSNPVLEPAGSFTLAAWVKSSTGGAMDIVNKGGTACWGSSYGLWNNGGLLGQYLSASTGQVISVGSYESVPAYLDGQWQHLVLIVDMTFHSATLLVDGRVTKSPAPSNLESGIRYSGGALEMTDLVFGGPGVPDCAYGAGYFTGELDDVQLFDRTLSGAEIDAYQTPFSTTTTVGVDPTTMLSGSTINFSAKVTPPPPHGQVVFYTSLNGAPEQQFIYSAVDAQGGAGYSNFNGQNMAVGHYTVRAVFTGGGPAGDSQSAAIPFEIDPIPTAVTLAARPFARPPGVDFPLDISLGWGNPAFSGGPPGQVSVYDITDGSETLITTAQPIWTYGVNPYLATVTIPGRDAGTYAFRVRYRGTEKYAAASADVTVDVAKGATTVIASATPTPVQQHHEAIVDANAGFQIIAVGDLPGTGTLQIRDADTNAVVATSTDPTKTLAFKSSDLALGLHHFVAEYLGDDHYVASVSDPVTVTIAADVVEASGVGVQYSTFYPYRDGYRDTVAAVGVRNEIASVAVRVYSPAGKLLKSLAVPSGTGSYAAAWSGRSSSGAILPAGKYKVVQVLTDAAKTARTVTSYTTLSPKRLSFTTATLQKKSSQYARKTTSWLAWSFTLPSATVYKSLVFSVYGKSDFGYGGFGPQDFSVCRSTWSPSCVTRHKGLPLGSGWVAVTGSGTLDHLGTTARLYAWSDYGTAYMVYGKVKVTYGVLR